MLQLSPTEDQKTKWTVIAAIFPFVLLFLAGAVLSGCNGCEPQRLDGSTTVGDDDDTTVDDCGYKIVAMPQGCDGCHGFPPKTARHPPNARCHRCHGYVVDENLSFVRHALHNNGEVNYAAGCTSCHGWNSDASPPQNLKGECGEDKDGIGSHVAMRDGDLPVHQVSCVNCHVVPTGTWSEGHIDGDGKVEVTFGFLAVLDGAKPVWDGTKCSGTYCHGATLKGGDYKDPAWGETGGAASKCGACHALADPNGNTNVKCHTCHPTTVDSDESILPRGTHINGVVDVGSDGKSARRAHK